MKSTFLVVVVVALAMAMAQGHQIEQSQPASKGEGPQLLPGYHHTSVGGVDSAGGRIWKDDGPDIHYEISLMGSERARVYAQQNPKASLSVARFPATGEIDVALDEERNVMVVSIDGHAHFHGTNIRSRKDVVETLLIANSVAGRSK